VKLSHGAQGVKGIGLDFVDFGFNYRMSEIQALMGWKQLKKLDQIVSERNVITREYSKGLIPLGFGVQEVHDDCRHNVQSAVFVVPTNISRDLLVKYLSECNVESTLGTYCLSGTSYFSGKYNNIQPCSKWLEDNTITLPCHADVNVRSIVELIESYIQNV